MDAGCCKNRCHLEPIEPSKPFPVKTASVLLGVLAIVAGVVYWVNEKSQHEEAMARIAAGTAPHLISVNEGLGILLAGVGGGIFVLGLLGGLALLFRHGTHEEAGDCNCPVAE